MQAVPIGTIANPTIEQKCGRRHCALDAIVAQPTPAIEPRKAKFSSPTTLRASLTLPKTWHWAWMEHARYCNDRFSNRCFMPNMSWESPVKEKRDLKVCLKKLLRQVGSKMDNEQSETETLVRNFFEKLSKLFPQTLGELPD